MTDGKVFLQIPIQLIKGLMMSPPKRVAAINDIISYAVFEIFVKFGGTMEKTLPKVYDFLGITNEGGIKGMIKSCQQGADVAAKIRTKSYFFIDKSKLFKLRDNAYSNDLYVAMTMFFALGSIQGKQSYWKSTNLFMLSRMDGRDKTISSADRLSAPVKKINTRRKLDKFKGMLEEHFGVSFWGYRMRGFYFSTKLSKEELIKKVSEPPQKHKRQEKKYKSSDKETLKKMVENNVLQVPNYEAVRKKTCN